MTGGGVYRKNVFEEIKAPNFPNAIKTRSKEFNQPQEQETLHQGNIVIKFIKTSYKGKILKATRGGGKT